ncbi:MAG: DUF4421 family protein [Bacteroidetes bacterium]|nr:DUF4421 family protein [Bacteroidota bacterium]
MRNTLFMNWGAKIKCKTIFAPLFFVYLLSLNSPILAANIDSLYIYKYNKLAVSFFKTYTSCELDFAPQRPDSFALPTAYSTSASLFNGFSFDYDKLSFSFGFADKTSTDYARKGRTLYNSFGFSINSINYRLESSYRRFIGFYDENIIRMITSNDSLVKPYFQNPSLHTTLVKVKGIHFFNKRNRFSYSAAYNNVQRQVRSAFTFMGVVNLYNLNINSSKGIIPVEAQAYYGSWKSLSAMNVTGLSMGPGFAFNFVLLKRLYLNFTLTAGLELNRLTYGNNMEGNAIEKYNFGINTAESRFAVGYNARNFYVSYNVRSDGVNYKMIDAKVTTSLITQNFIIGYRFKVREKGPLNKLRQSKLYNRAFK